MVNIEALVPPIEKGLSSDPEYLSVGNTIFDRVRFNRKTPPKVGGSGGASSRYPPPEQVSLFENTAPVLPEVTTTPSADYIAESVDEGTAYWRRILEFFKPKPKPITYEADRLGTDSAGDTTTGYGGQIQL